VESQFTSQKDAQMSGFSNDITTHVRTAPALEKASEKKAITSHFNTFKVR